VCGGPRLEARRAFFMGFARAIEGGHRIAGSTQFNDIEECTPDLIVGSSGL
jgi:hypothetical protein